MTCMVQNAYYSVLGEAEQFNEYRLLYSLFFILFFAPNNLFNILFTYIYDIQTTQCPQSHDAFKYQT